MYVGAPMNNCSGVVWARTASKLTKRKKLYETCDKIIEKDKSTKLNGTF